MKILFLGHFVPFPPHGGSLQRTHHVIRQAARKNEVHLVALNQRALLPTLEQLDAAVAALREFCAHVCVFPIPSDAHPLRWYGLLLSNLFSREPYSMWRYRSAELAAHVRELASRVDFDAVHIDTIATAPYAELVPGVPRLLNHHNVESALLLRRASSLRNPLRRGYMAHQGRKLARAEREWVARVEVNAAVSDPDGEILAAMAPDARIVTIPNGTDTFYFTPATAEGSFELIFAGGQNWYPNRDAMEYFCCEIFPEIRRAEPRAVMHVVGSAPSDAVRRAAASQPGIEIHGFVDDIRPLLARSAVYVVPIRVGGGTRLKILDAAAAGKAIVSTSIGCEGIAVTPGQDILIGDTPEAFARQVLSALGDDGLRRRIESNARRLAEDRYAWDVIGRCLNDVYASLER